MVPKITVSMKDVPAPNDTLPKSTTEQCSFLTLQISSLPIG